MNRKLLTDNRSGQSLAHYIGAEDQLMPANNNEEEAGNPLLSIWRRRWTVLLITICCGAAAVAYLRLATKFYTSTTRLSIQAPLTSLPGTGQGLVDQTGDVAYLNRQLAIIQSPSLLKEASKLLLGQDASDRELRQFSGMLAGSLAVDLGRIDGIISISYDSPNAEEAARCDQAIAEAYQNWMTQNHSSGSKTLAASLRAEKAKIDAALQTQNDKLRTFLTQNPDVSIKSDTNVNPNRAEVAQLNAALTTAQLGTIQARSLVAAAEAVKDTPSRLFHLAQAQKTPGTSAIDTQVNTIQTQLDQAELNLSMLLQKYPPGHPTVQQVKQFVDQLTARLATVQKQFGEEYLQSVQQQLDQATILEEETAKQLAQSRAKVTDINSAEWRANDLEQTVQNTDKMSSALDSRIKELDVSGDVETPNIQTIEYPKIEDRPSKPQPARILALVLVIGLMLGSGFAIVRDKMDGRLRSAEEIAAFLGLPVIGAVPHMKRNLTALARSQAAHWDPLSEVAESYRAVRTALHFGVPSGHAKTIVVTSPAPGDGKSTLASNLAITMAQAGKHTLLLDADFRRPVQHRLFEVPDDSGLTSVLAGQEPLNKAIHRTLVEGLDLLPAGPMPLNPSELLNGEAFGEILDELSQKYDHIVLDCPPVMAVTDARILGAVCDVTILVLRAAKTTRKAAELSRAGLLSVKARLLGCVVNDVPKGEQQYGYYGDYTYTPLETRRRLTDENASAEESNGRSNSPRARRLPSPSSAETAR